MPDLIRTKFLVLEPGKPAIEGEVDWPEKPSRQQMRDVVLREAPGVGTSPEHVTILGPDNETRCDMFVHDEGVRLGLPINDEATVHYHRASIVSQGLAHHESWPKVHGPAVLFLRRVWF